VRRRIARWASLAAAAAIAAISGPSEANPSVWSRARDPEIDRRLDLVSQAEIQQLKYQRLLRARMPREDAAALGELYLRQAADLLEQAGATTSRDPRLRFRLAEVYEALGQTTKAVKLLEDIARASPPAPLQADVYAALAVDYARLGRHADEVKAYEKALAVQPIPYHRARLLANRAEAFMVLGDLEAAIQGYRGALALLTSPNEMVQLGASTLWGLGVALDRSGDLDAGLESLRLARSYDPADQQITGPSWFYVPPYDRFWYAALGHWSSARLATLGAVRMEEYGRAISSWEEYLANAAAGDQWLPIARARLRQCEKERDAARRSSLRGPRAPAVEPRRR
jgi:tetratricopeptide (TPR) repeat protein